MAALPIKSAWATGVVNSIVASGNTSDFANRRTHGCELFERTTVAKLKFGSTSYVG